MKYVNYHKHSSLSNIKVPDSALKMTDYIKRAKELNHTIVSSVEHGFQGDIFTLNRLCLESNLDYIFGAEFYYVPSFENKEDGKKDGTNTHLIVIRKNHEGYKKINKALSIANEDGFYRRPRIDNNILFGLFEYGDVIITSACVAGILSRENAEEMVVKLKERFKEDFYLEIQSHNIECQKNLNKKALYYSEKYGIELIHANDSHYISSEDKKYRDIYIKAKGFYYKEDNENSMILDYPDSDTIFKRYKEQGVLSEEQVFRALENTLVFEKCTNVANLDTEFKIPIFSENPKKELREIINYEFKALGYDKLPKDRKKQTLDAIRNEVDIIEKAGMSSYFIMDYKICKLATEKYNGKLTKTGRGSAVSFIVNRLLRLTEINRTVSPITLYPTRFMSAERILGARTLPDIDLNTVDREPFIKATEDIAGEENCAWLISYKPLQQKSAFKLYCRGLGISFKEADKISDDLESYIDDKKWGKIIKDSSFFIGTIESVSESPCSELIYYKPVVEEIGLIRTKNKTVCLLDAYNCEYYKFIKNDYLKVTVWELIDNVCKLANIPIPTIEELEEKIDDKTWAIYEKGLTATINQTDSDFSRELVKRYKPRSISEMSAFVACIRPSFASLRDNFLDRKPYSTGEKELDDLLEDSFHYLMYQESIMKLLIWLGVKESESYSLLKKIAKKKFTQEELETLHTNLKKKWKEKIGNLDNFDKTWQVVEDASKYSFNASHSLSYAYDSVYGAYLKANYPLEYFTVALDTYSGDMKRTSMLTQELKEFDIKLKNASFEKTGAKYTFDRESRTIYKGLESIKELNQTCGEVLGALSENKPNTFVELLYEASKSIYSNQINILIGLGFFKHYGRIPFLKEVARMYYNLKGRKRFSVNKLGKFLPIFEKCRSKKTAKAITIEDKLPLMIELEKIIKDMTKDEKTSIKEVISNFYEYTGSCNLKFNVPKDICIVVSDPKEYNFATSIQLHNVRTGKTEKFLIGKNKWNLERLEKYDLIKNTLIDRDKRGSYWLKSYERGNDILW